MLRRLLLVIALIAPLALVRATPAHAATLRVGVAGPQCPSPTHATIQAAVNAAATGDTIEVCPGTYTEQVTIAGAAKNGITLRSIVSRQAVIKAPATLAEPGDLIRINGASNVSIADFTISGPLPNALFCSVEVRTGIKVDGGGSATIRGNLITEIRAADPSLRGCQNGIAILVGRGSMMQTGRATIQNNTVDKYQKGGIVVDNSGSRATISGNTVRGEGPVNYIAQNGIQVSRGATANLQGNTVSDHTYALAPSSSASGLLLFEGGNGIEVSGNNATRNDDNLALAATDRAQVDGNTLTDSTFYDGIFADVDSQSNRFRGNTARRNREHDCHDESTGNGTAGTANTWQFNTGDTSTPPGICRTGLSIVGPSSSATQSAQTAQGARTAPRRPQPFDSR